MANDISPRDAVLRAATAFDDFQRQINDLNDKLRESLVAIEGRNARIEQLEIALAEERNNAASYRNERDQAIQERDHLRHIFYSFKVQIEEITYPMPAPTLVRKVPTVVDPEEAPSVSGEHLGDNPTDHPTH